jgi:hypothetical protein
LSFIPCGDDVRNFRLIDGASLIFYRGAFLNSVLSTVTHRMNTGQETKAESSQWFRRFRHWDSPVNRPDKCLTLESDRVAPFFFNLSGLRCVA